MARISLSGGVRGKELPPNGHVSLWMEEAKLSPDTLKAAEAKRLKTVVKSRSFHEDAEETLLETIIQQGLDHECVCSDT